MGRLKGDRVAGTCGFSLTNGLERGTPPHATGHLSAGGVLVPQAAIRFCTGSALGLLVRTHGMRADGARLSPRMVAHTPRAAGCMPHAVPALPHMRSHTRHVKLGSSETRGDTWAHAV